MPSFLQNLRRRSQASFRHDKSSTSAPTHANGHPPLPKSKSSTTLNSANGSATPPGSTPSEASYSNVRTNGNGASGTATPMFPPSRPPINTNRYSVNGNTLVSPTTNGSQRSLAGSPWAPKVLSVTENSWVHQKILLIAGQCGDPSQRPLDGELTIHHHLDTFPSQLWPVHDCHFKALVHLQPGPNQIRMEFTSRKLSSGNTLPGHTSTIQINYLPLNNVPPLQLAIIVGKDSPCTFDTTPERREREGNGLDTALRKFKMSAYLWQAFTGEQMNRNGFGRRCFRFEEEWQQGTLTSNDLETGQMRNEAKIHIIRSEKTVKEIRDLDIAQQYDKATKKGDLYGIAMKAVKDYFRPRDGQKQYVSCLFLDTHWDPQVKTLRGHAALGGGDGGVQLAIFGSHALHTYPTSIEEVVKVFMDCTPTNTKFVANDCNESGSNWEAANIGIGAHLHETGHLLGCPHQENGVMLRDYVKLNRSFTTQEPFSTRTKSQGHKPVLAHEECTWHRLDCLRFRFHPCFRMPTDPIPSGDMSVQVWGVGNATVLVTAPSGITFIELYPDGDDVCHTHIEYIIDQSTGTVRSPSQVALTESDLQARLPEKKRKKKLKLEIHSVGQGKQVVQDFSELVSKQARIKLPNGRLGFRSSKLGFSKQENSRPQEVILESTYIQTKLLMYIRVYHGFALDGIEFIYEDTSSQLFGKKGGKQGGSTFELDTRRGEIIMGFYLRAGLWIDGIQILTSLGRKSEIYGNPTGGSGHTLIPPRGYSIAGISGSCGNWVDGFQLIITR